MHSDITTFEKTSVCLQRKKNTPLQNDYPKQFSDTEKPGIWFLEDFYKDPEEARTMILGKEFDEQFLDISGIKENYDCETQDELEASINNDIQIRYFPSSENGEVVAKAANLIKDTDYTVTCNSFDEENGEAELTIEGIGDHTGTYQIRVRLFSALVKKAPFPVKNLVYNGSPQALVEEGEAEYGTMVYAACKADDPEPDPSLYTTEIPTATNAGEYDLWYKVIGDEKHKST